MPAKNETAKLIRSKWAPQIGELCRSYVDPALFLPSAVDAVNRLEKECTGTSIVKTVFNGASLGLLFSSALGQMHIVPFKNGALSKKADRDVYEAQLVVGYPGYTELAFRNRWLKSLTTDVVLRGEEFEQWTDENGRHIKHVPGRERVATPANIELAYMVYQTIDGGTGVYVVQKSEIDKAKNDRSDAWKYHYASMAQKVPIVRCARREWRLSQLPQLALALRLDDQAERGEQQENLSGVPIDAIATRKADVLTLDAPEEPGDPFANPVTEDELTALWTFWTSQNEQGTAETFRGMLNQWTEIPPDKLRDPKLWDRPTLELCQRNLGVTSESAFSV